MAISGPPRSEVRAGKKPAHMGHSGTVNATCRGKEQYDRATANLIARKSKKAKLNTYLCPFCNHWHVGKNEKGK